MSSLYKVLEFKYFHLYGIIIFKNETFKSKMNLLQSYIDGSICKILMFYNNYVINLINCRYQCLKSKYL